MLGTGNRGSFRPAVASMMVRTGGSPRPQIRLKERVRTASETRLLVTVRRGSRVHVLRSSMPRAAQRVSS